MKNLKGYSPLPSNVYIAKSKLHGMGIFAKQVIPADFDFGITHVADQRFPDGYIRTSLGEWVNHSSNPNCLMYEDADTFRMKTLAAIDPDEELTVDYRPWYNDHTVSRFK